jgi:hypothetical protein
MASVLAKMRVSALRLASKAAINLPRMWAVLTKLLPLKCPQRLGNVWSSSWIMAAPARSNSRTVRWVLSALPNPVSASTMTGKFTRSHTRPIVCATSLAVTKPTSLRPKRV